MIISEFYCIIPCSLIDLESSFNKVWTMYSAKYYLAIYNDDSYDDDNPVLDELGNRMYTYVNNEDSTDASLFRKQISSIKRKRNSY